MPTNTWIAAEAGNASVDGNWSLGHAPTTGEDVVFDGTSVNNCSWNVTASIGSLTLDTGYSGVVTQACEVTISGDCDIVAGTLTGDDTNDFNVGGNFTKTGGVITGSVLILAMSGANKSLKVNASTTFDTLKFLNNITLHASTAQCNANKIQVDSDCTLTIPSGRLLLYLIAAGSTFSNSGTITGDGTLNVYAYGGSASLNTGTITVASFIFSTSGSSTANTTITLTANVSTTSSMAISSSHATYTMTLDLNDFNLSCVGFELGTRGICKLGSGTLTDTGNFDAVGTGSDFDPETGTVILSGISKTVELQATNYFYKLTVSGVYSMSSGITVTNYCEISGSLIGNVLEIDSTLEFSLTVSGVCGVVYVNGSALSNIMYLSDSMCGTVYFNETSTIHFDSIFLIVDAEKWTNCTVLVTSTIMTWYLNCTDTLENITQSVGGLDIGVIYDVYLDGAEWTEIISNASGYISFYYDDWGHNFSINAALWITSVPSEFAPFYVTYWYNVTVSLPGSTITITTNADWLEVIGTDQLRGIPGDSDTGYYWVNVTATLGALSDYQNYTLEVNQEVDEMDYAILIGLVFGGLLTVIGYVDRRMMFLAGIAWVIIGLVAFLPYGEMFMVLAVGFGMVQMITGVFEYVPS